MINPMTESDSLTLLGKISAVLAVPSISLVIFCKTKLTPAVFGLQSLHSLWSAPQNHGRPSESRAPNQGSWLGLPWSRITSGFECHGIEDSRGSRDTMVAGRYEGALFGSSRGRELKTRRLLAAKARKGGAMGSWVRYEAMALVALVTFGSAV